MGSCGFGGVCRKMSIARRSPLTGPSPPAALGRAVIVFPAMGHRSGPWIGSCAIAILATAIGCASLPPCPAKGGPAWRELTSDHFVLVPDLHRERPWRRSERWKTPARRCWRVCGPGPPDHPGRARPSRWLRCTRPGGSRERTSPECTSRRPPFPATLLISPGPQAAGSGQARAGPRAGPVLPAGPAQLVRGRARHLPRHDPVRP